MASMLRQNLIALNAPSPMTGLLLPTASITSYSKEKNPPQKSKKMFAMLQPTVDFL